MSEAVSALQGAVSEGFARIEETGLRGMITLRCNLASGALAKALKAVLGAKVPGQRRIVDGAGGRVAWMSPDELLILCAHDRAQAMVGELAAALGREHALVVNVSDARAVFAVSGTGAREVLAKLAPVDLSDEAFQPGEIRRTRLAQVPAAFWINQDGRFEIVCFRSVAQYVFDILKVSAEPGGEVGVLA